MPWFHRRSDEEKQQQAAAQAEQKASTAELERGGIPLYAQRRLDEMRQDQGLFTSDLSVNEFLLARQAGIQPISQVMGSAVYHVGWQYIGTWMSSGEMTVISHAMNTARGLALSRMEQEATRVGADVVVGVHLSHQGMGLAEHLEFQAFGTAARVQNAPHTTGKPGLTNLSGQDFWKLYQSGYWPVGVVAGSTVYRAVPGWTGQWAMSGWGGWNNQEMTDFTSGLYTARHLAMRRVRDEAGQRLGAAGVVGVTIDQDEEEYEVDTGGNNSRTDLIITFHVIGTAIVELSSGTHIPEIRSIIDLRS